MFVIFGILIIPNCKSVYNFDSNLTLTNFTLQFFRVVKMTYGIFAPYCRVCKHTIQ